MEHAGKPSSGAARRAAPRRRAALMAVAVIPVILACSPVVTRLASAPASSLRVRISFEQALVPGESTTVEVVMEDERGTYVEFTGGQTLSFDGVTLDSGGTFFSAKVPRKASGEDAYALTYTDEHGHQTVVHIPGPSQDFAILDPAADSQIPLPRPVEASSQAVETPTSTSIQPRPPVLADAPLTARYSPPYPPDSMPSDPGSSGAPNRYDVALSAYGPCADAWPRCIPVGGVPTAPSGTATIDDRAWPWGTGFETLAPGPGFIGATVELAWNLPKSGFLSCYVQFHDHVSVPVTWV